MKRTFNTPKDMVTNDRTYRTMENRLEKKFPDKHIGIADGKFVRAIDSLEDAWAIASPLENVLVTRVAEKPRRTRILGSSLVAIDVDSSGDDAHSKCDNRSAEYGHN